MSLLADDPPGLAGAGHLLQHLHYPRLESEAQAVGAHVRIDRTADALVYTITGPAAELRYLATILRSTLQPPQAGEGARLTAQRDLAEERLAEWETADRHLRSALRTRLFPGDISGAGTDGSAARLARRPLDEVWARMYRPERLSVLAVGDIDLDLVRREFADLPEGVVVPGGSAMTDTATLVPLAPAEATRGWFGIGYEASDLPPAAVSIAARILGDALAERLPGSEATGEHWWTHHGQALVLMAAVPPTLVASAPGVVQGLPSSIVAQLTDAAVATAARAIRHDMLFYSRTPDRMAEVLGHFIDRGGDASSAQAFYAELDRVRADDVRAVLREVTAGTAVRVEIPPQKLLVNP
jgi:predicted Zn-dependent peptidase